MYEFSQPSLPSSVARLQPAVFGSDTADRVVQPASGVRSHRSDVIPSLDGIRAISVLIVVLGHSGLQAIVPAGFGVTIFFFLSGYLISTLMLAEHDRSGGLNVPRFLRPSRLQTDASVDRHLGGRLWAHLFRAAGRRYHRQGADGSAFIFRQLLWAVLRSRQHDPGRHGYSLVPRRRGAFLYLLPARDDHAAG